MGAHSLYQIKDDRQMNVNVLTVSQINKFIKSLIETSAPLKRVYVKGEISNFKRNAFSGHCYFSLKDENSQLGCIMYSSNAAGLRFEPETGMTVLCYGRISVYDKGGNYQLAVDDMQPDGLGSLYLAMIQLKERLDKEGLFDEGRKKALPRFPKKIGVVTSNTGAAVADIKNITARRYPLAEIVIAPTIVQGAQAAQDIADSIKLLDGRGDIDVIIFGRGGGSEEDLWCFNDEKVVRAVAACNTPIISAVGHKTDSPLCDLAADYAAPTPSAAAEKVCPDINELYFELSILKRRLNEAMCGGLEDRMRALSDITSSPILENFDSLINTYSENIDVLSQRINESVSHILENKLNALRAAAGRLNALSPLAVLARGYSVVKSGNNVIKSVSQLKQNDDITLVLTDGSANAVITEVFENEQ